MLQALFLLVLTLAIAMGLQPALAQTAPCTLTDIDQDDDGLIEICDLEGLNAIRYQIDGTGYRASGSATKITAGCPATGCKGYELTRDLDFNDAKSYRNASANKSRWTTGAGWQPIGNDYPNALQAVFNGSGYTLSNLMINRGSTSHVGLFGYARGESRIMEVGLLNVNIIGQRRVGGLVGYSYGSSIKNSYATGAVSGAGDLANVGGLVGWNDRGTITGSYATSSVSGSYNVGGLAGINGGTITNSYATGAVSGAGSYANIGGLVGYNNRATITNSYATGSVTGTADIGGLVGSNDHGTITNSYAMGTVSGTGFSANAGGLIGHNFGGTITNSHATGVVRGTSPSADLGGLIGYNLGGNTTNSYATGSVTGTSSHANVGGLVGYNRGTMTNSYATGSVRGTSPSADVGGLIGYNSGADITNSYAIGSVTGTSSFAYVGGLVGRNQSSNITDSYWDEQTSGQTTSAGGEGKTAVELREPTMATGIYRRWSTSAWDFGTTKQYPALKYSDGTVMPNQGRAQPEDVAQMPQVEIAGVPAGVVNEGDSITLTASPSSTASIIPLNYSWSQVSGGDLPIESTTRSSVTIEVPEDYVATSVNSNNLVLALEVSAYAGSIRRQIAITIAKRNNGKITALSAPSLNERELTAPSIDLSSDPDGGGSNIGYQWQSRESTGTAWKDISPGMSEVYAIPKNVFGTVQYRVVVSYTDGQGYSEEVFSQAVTYEGIELPISAVNPVLCDPTDVDQDDDGLIEICDLGGLNAIRYQLDGSGYKASGSATKITAGCPATGCKGYELAQDLDFNDNNSYSSTSNKIIWTTGTGWQPIGTGDSPFNAIFKANKYSISNLMIDRPSARNIGLFGGIGSSARIEGVALINLNVRGDWRIGSLVGLNSSGGVISNSYATGIIQGGNSAGGLVGANHGRITNSYTNVSVSGGTYIGGIVGRNFIGGTVTNSYTVPRVDASGSSMGAILGYNSVGNNTVVNSYWDTSVSGIFDGDYGIGLTTEQLQSPRAAGRTPTDIYYGWSANMWDFGTTEQYPALKYSDGTVMPNQSRERPDMPQAEIASLTSCGTTDIDQDDDGLIEICNLEGLHAMRYHMGGIGYRAYQFAPMITMGCRPDGGCIGYELTQDLDFNDDDSYSSTANKVIWTTGRGWPPIPRFTATFDGNGYTISNLMINRPNTNRLGLFSRVERRSKIIGIGLLDISVTGTAHVGGLAGVNYASITNSYAMGTVSGTGNVGGLVGGNVDAITNSYAAVSVEGTGSYVNVGGLVGGNGGTITNSHATGFVTGSGSNADVGGLVGSNWNGSITNSHATGSVKGSGRAPGVGGLVGDDYQGSITNSYATGSVTATGSFVKVGGLIGTNEVSITTIANSYATGSVTGRGQYAIAAGGLFGFYDRGRITNSYATGSVKGNGYTDGIGGLVGRNVRGKIANSYATGSATGTNRHVGGLVGLNHWGSSTNSYWDKQTSGRTTSAGGMAKTTTQLQSPTTATGIYSSWGTDVWDFGTSEQYPALKYSDGTVIPNQGRVQPEDVPQIPQVEIAGVPTSAVDEGDSITLTASSASGASIIPLSYSWSQVSGGDVLIEPTTQSSVTIEVPEDYVSAGANTVNLAIMLDVISDVGSTSQHVSITIAKRNNSKITALGAPSLNERELAAPAIDLSSDPDGSGSNISYQWQSRESTATAWADVLTVADTKETYTIPDGIISGTQYRVVISYTDGQGYSEEVASQAIAYERGYSLIEIASLTSCGTTDIDQDDDGLIEICNLEGLNAIRYQTDGTGYRASSSTMKIIAGCPATGCKGYELSQDLDFNDDNSYSSTANKITWTTGEGWQPIKAEASPFNAIFKANHYRISNLMIYRPSANNIGLFGRIGGSARIEDVGLINVSIRGIWGVGSLVGTNSGGVISNSYATGTIRGGSSAGGLVGDNVGRVSNSYTNVSVSGGSYIGGIVGCNFDGGTVANSYTVSRIDSSDGSAGGLLGYNDAGGSIVVNSYWDRDINGIFDGAYGVGLTTEQLQSPIAAGSISTDIYYGWSTDVWDFGTTEQYPALKYSDGTVLPNQPRERPDMPQMPQVEIAGVPTSAVGEGDSITLTASFSSSASITPLNYNWSQVSGESSLIEPTSLSSVTIEVPEDYVSADANTVNLVIMLDVISDVGSTSQHVSITIAKRNNGKIAALGAPSLNERELTAPAIDLSGDPDGGGSNISYQWQSRESSQTTQTAWIWINVPAGTNRAHTIAEDVTGAFQYRVVVSYTDGQGYSEEVASQAIAYERGYSLMEIASLTSCGTTDIDQDDDGLIEICNLEGLDAIRYQTDGTGYKASGSATKITAGCPATGCKGYELARDLDFNDDNSYSSTHNKITWTTGRGWEPIGNSSSNAFNATFNGNGHTISNLMINRPNASNVGLFGYVRDQSKTVNVGLLNIDILAGSYVGGLVGHNYGNVINSYAMGSVTANRHGVGGLAGHNHGTIRISYAAASVTRIGQDASGIGGLVGENSYEGIITGSYATGSVTGAGLLASSGGLVGINISGGSITNSYATGSVTGSDANRRLGGLVGTSHSGSSITNSYATGSVRGNSPFDSIGGLIGWNYRSTITNSYATGSVTSSGEYALIGGLVGHNSNGTITNSYATGLVTGTGRIADIGGLVGRSSSGIIISSYTTSFVTGVPTNVKVGGLVGRNNYGSATTSYWDKQTSGRTTSDGGEGKTTVELQEPTTATRIYSSWSTSVWDFGTTEQYPALKYSDGTVMPNQPRERPDLSHRLSVEIAGVPAGAINEGDSITLTASLQSNASNIPLSYRWEQTLGGDLLVEPTTLSSVTIEVPEDYVSADANTVNLAIMLDVISDVGKYFTTCINHYSQAQQRQDCSH